MAALGYEMLNAPFGTARLLESLPPEGSLSLSLCFLILGFSLFSAFRRLTVKHEAKTGLSMESTAEMF